MKEIIKNEKDLGVFIEEFGDCNQELTYLAMDDDGYLFTVFGCCHATDAFRVAGGMSLVITDDDYSEEMNKQAESEHPELNGFELK